MIAVTRSFAFIVASLAAYGQMNTGEISGSVQDATGGRLRGATITMLRVKSGQKFTAVSNHSGEYLFARLPVGGYSVVAGAVNFRQSSVHSLDVHAGDRLRRDFVLELGNSADVVTVNVES